MQNHCSVLYHDQQNEDHPDFVVSKEIRTVLSRELPDYELIGLPAPKVLRDDEGEWVDYTYVNHYLCNGGVVLCAFDDPNDQVAAAILRRVHPTRTVVLVDARPIFERGGGIHCITQQQPCE